MPHDGHFSTVTATAQVMGIECISRGLYRTSVFFEKRLAKAKGMRYNRHEIFFLKGFLP